MIAFSKILIANRGEIACRIIRTAKALGYRTVAVYSDTDADALHGRQADEAVRIGPPPVQDSYLNVDALLAAAKLAGADAVHPGYGFLSENAAFAEACTQAGLVFIGPPAAAIAAMGNKARAKALMQAAGVPCVPGYDGPDQSDERFMMEGRHIGFPVMVKAAAGGGGRGMRLVASADDLANALARARSEATSAFGSDELILEHVVPEARHIEIQVFADQHGNVIHLGERDCSIQRRHQKVIEETPSPAVSTELRAKMGDAAVAAARAIGYVGAGTVEFLLDQSGKFYFLEMNTRLQVEHPVTEAVTGLDLVAWQLQVAAGERLPLDQHEVRFSGHAIEARLYAEDPHKSFLPQTGTLIDWRPASGAGVRIDHALAPGQSVSPFYDPMLAKVIAHGATREEARRRLLAALEGTVALGLTTNRSFLIATAPAPRLRRRGSDDHVHSTVFSGGERRHAPPAGRSADAGDRGGAAVRGPKAQHRQRVARNHELVFDGHCSLAFTFDIERRASFGQHHGCRAGWIFGSAGQGRGRGCDRRTRRTLASLHRLRPAADRALRSFRTACCISISTEPPSPCARPLSRRPALDAATVPPASLRR